jgi:hypothetical protein
MASEIFAHHFDLAPAIGFGDDRENRFVESAAEEFNLSAAGQLAQDVPDFGMAFSKKFEQWTGVMGRKLDRRVSRQNPEKGKITIPDSVLEHPAEIPDGLVVVNAE